ncbi:serine/threonine-protein kinase [Tahibacter harae]|uniref:Serine/threonine-protein kinase n=1 Tax=Tahibacter harae TaxID=2963937 RepID=A0ABT1QP78_9GAMM|nr:serine/threonine-protein kinase [Tahibacter harae]MCQ4164080.1 serine/threonine-protein kinase [Tahibacter harae]
MTSSSIDRIKQLFDQLVELPLEQRDGWLDAQADLDQETRRHLQGLLAADARVADLTSRPALGRSPADPRNWIGRRIGPYEIVRELGRGGMGSVFLGSRVDGGVAQQVAIKIVRPDMLDTNTLARFRLERQVLAVLQHPNIAGMLDLGELDDGSPYAVMEYVDGAPIHVHVRERQLDLRQRLQLFLQVCDAVAYAHANMVVHRDLKPGNVLVDRGGRPRLLDFGIAKPLQSRLGAVEVEETSAAQRFLSPAHAAPEQLRDGRVGAACDVYGLGTLLYELLTGLPPFALGERSLAELQHEILEVDPPAPSRRSEQARRLGVDRDLDLITLRCLRKQPADRYSSVEHLAEDVRNHLQGRPVQARRGNAWYRASRFAARHRLAVSLAGVALAVAGTGAALLWRQQLATAAQRSRADEMTSLITDAVASLDPNSSKLDLSAREVFERVAAQAKASPRLEPDSRARVLAAIAAINLDLGQPQQAERLLADIDPGLLAPEQRNEVLLNRTRALLDTGRHDEAQALIRRGLAESADPAAAARWKLHEAEWEASQGREGESLAMIEAIDPALLSPADQEARASQRVLMLMSSGDAALRAEAIPALSALIAAQKARLGENAPAVLDTMNLLILQQVRASKVDQAEQLGNVQMRIAETVFGRNSLRFGAALSTAAMIERARGNFARAYELHREELEIVKAQSGETTPAAAKVYLNLALCADKIGKVEESAGYYRLATDTAAKVWPPLHLNVFLFRAGHALFLAEQGKYAEAQALVRLSLADAERYPQLKEKDIHPFALAVDALGDYHANPTPARREALAKALRDSADNAMARSTREATQMLTEVVGRLGVEPAPAKPVEAQQATAAVQGKPEAVAQAQGKPPAGQAQGKQPAPSDQGKPAAARQDQGKSGSPQSDQPGSDAPRQGQK